MHYLCNFRRLNTYSTSLHASSFQVNCFSTIFNASDPQYLLKRDIRNHQNPEEPQNFRPLFNEILSIIGTEHIIPDNNPVEFSLSKETQVASGVSEPKQPHRSVSVCEYSEKKANAGDGDFSSLQDTQMDNSVAIDVSPVVHKITEIVRGQDCTISMVEKLEKAGIEYDAEVVEKVLKRCFKVPHLALRFFSWVKSKGFQHTVETYSVMLYIAGDAKELRVVDNLVEEMGKNACERNMKTWTILMYCYEKAKLASKALTVFEEMKKAGIEPDAIVYRQMLRSLCNARKGDVALEFYNEMILDGMEIDLSLYKRLLSCLAQSEDISGIHAVGNNMARKHLIPEKYVSTIILKSFCIAGRMNEALELIRCLKDKDIDVGADQMEILVKGLCRADRISDALEIVDILNKRNVINCKIYGMVIEAYLSRNDICEAFDLFKHVKMLGHSPTLSTYTNLLQHLFWRGEYQKALEFYNEMMDAGVRLDSVAMTAVIAGHVRQNHVTEAWDMLKRTTECGIKPTKKTYSIFIKELCRVSATDDIFKVLSEMQAREVTIGDDIYQCITCYLEKKGEKENLEKVKQMQRTCNLPIQKNEACTVDVIEQPLSIEGLMAKETQQVGSDVYMLQSTSRIVKEHEVHEICKVLSSSTDWDLVQEKLEKYMINYKPEHVVGILRNCSLHGGAALRFFTWVGDKSGYTHTTESYNMAIKISGQGKDFKKMRSLFSEMRRKGCLVTSDTWTILITQYGRTGMTNIASRLFREMKANGCKPTRSTYRSLMISLCGKKGRKVEEAIQTFNEMIQYGYVPDKESIETYLGCLCETGRLFEAKECMYSLRRIGFTTPLSCSLYIRALCRAGRLEEAFAVLDEVGPERHILDQCTYGSLVHGLLRRGKLEEALEKIESMKQVGVNPTVHVYTSLIVHFFMGKQMDKALEMFEEMKRVGCEPNIVTYSAIIRGYMNTEKVDDAWNVFNHIRENGPMPDYKTYSMFISCLCKIGKSEDAVRLISDMSARGIIPSTVNFREVFFGLNREGKHEIAQAVMRKKWELKNRRKL